MVLTLLAAGDAPSAHVTRHVLLTHFQTGLASLVVDALLVGAAAVYLVGVRALGRRRRRLGRRWPVGRTVAWFAGLAMVFVGIGSGLAAYEDLNPSAHVVQHLLLMMFAPPLLVLGRPVTVLAQAASRRVQVGVVRFFGSPAVRALTGTVAWPLYYGTMAAFFLTPIYADSVRTPTFHDLTHGWFLVVGCLFWAGLVGVDLPAQRPAHRRSPTGRMATLLVGMPVESAIAVALLFWPWALAPGQPASAAHSAGLVLWMGSMVSSGVGVVVVLRQWTAADRRGVRRSLATAAAHGGARVGGYEVRADGSAVPVVRQRATTPGA